MREKLGGEKGERKGIREGKGDGEEKRLGGLDMGISVRGRERELGERKR